MLQDDRDSVLIAGGQALNGRRPDIARQSDGGAADATSP
jgi:hypothetical protein